MKKNKISTAGLLILAALTLLAGCSRGGGGGTTTDIYYDSGIPTAGWKHDFTGRGWAVRFTPPTTPVTLTWSRIYIYSDYLVGPLEIHVWASDQVTELVTPFLAAPTADNSWLEIDIPDVVMDDEFYIGCLQTDIEGPRVGVDQSAPSLHSYSFDGVLFVQLYDADIMIRAVVAQ